MSKSFFSSQIIDKEKGCVLWNELRKIRNKDLNDSKLDHMFGPPFKLYPSQMAFDMCWYQFFKDIDNPPRFTLNSMYRMRRGSSIHREIQDDFLKSGLCYEVPTDKLTKEQISKLKYHAPELPFTDLDTLVSGRADLLLNIKKKPVLVEIKTTYLEETAWIKDKPIEKKVDQYNKHLCQAAVCTYVINKMRFLDQKIDQFVLMYLDPRFEPEDQQGEEERWFNIVDYEKACEDLIAMGCEERQRYIDKTQDGCHFLNCKRHRSKE